MPAKMSAILSTGFEARVQRGYHGNFGFVRPSYDTSHELLRVYVQPCRQPPLSLSVASLPGSLTVIPKPFSHLFIISAGKVSAWMKLRVQPKVLPTKAAHRTALSQEVIYIPLGRGTCHIKVMKLPCLLFLAHSYNICQVFLFALYTHMCI